MIVAALISAAAAQVTHAQEFEFSAQQTAGPGSATLTLQVVDPALTTGQDYRASLNSSAGGLVYSIVNATTGVTVVPPTPIDEPSAIFDGLRAQLVQTDSRIEQLQEVSYAGSPVAPPVHIFRPGDRKGLGGPNSTGEFTFVSGAGGGFGDIASHERNTAGFDYEIRFDGNPLGRNKLIYAFQGTGTINVPFSVWNIGSATPDDTSDDRQVLAIGFDDGGSPTEYDGGAAPADGGPGNMYDRIYIFEINQSAIGVADLNNDGVVDYDDVLQDIANNGGDISRQLAGRPYLGNRVLSRFSMVSLVGDPKYIPPAGTTIRITTSKPASDGDVFEFTAPEFELFVTPFALDFLNVRAGSPSIQSLLVHNSGATALQVSDIVFESNDFSVSTTSFLLAPGDSAAIDVTFVSATDGANETSLTIVSNDRFFPRYEIPIRTEALPVADGRIDIISRLDIRQDGVIRSDVADIWGYFDAATSREYALVGYGIFADPPNAGLSIVDVTEPAQPFEVANLSSVLGFDVKVWQSYAYTVNGIAGNGAIIDLSDPQNPQVVGSFPSSHNIFVSDDGFLVSSAPGVIYDLNQDPKRPAEIWRDPNPSGHDAAIVADRFYDFHGGLGTFIYDWSNPREPQLLGAITDPAIQFHHSGWPTEDGNFLFVCDELARHPTADFTVWDISDIGNPAKVFEFAHPGATIHNFYVVGDYAYVSYYTQGYWIFDVSNPRQPVVVDSFDTSPDFQGEGFNGAFGVYPFAPSGNVFVSDSEKGLHAFASLTQAPTSVDDERLPVHFVLHDNYPNPFNPETRIVFDLATAADVKIEIFNTAGQIVRTLVDAEKTAGSHQVDWNGLSDSGLAVSSGVYFYRIRTRGFTDSRRMLLLR